LTTLLPASLIVALLAGCGGPAPGEHDADGAVAAGKAAANSKQPAESSLSASGPASAPAGASTRTRPPGETAIDSQRGDENQVDDAVADSGQHAQSGGAEENSSPPAESIKESKTPHAETLPDDSPPTAEGQAPSEKASVQSSHFAADVQSAPPPDWPQFRGPDGQGRSPARGLPVRWHEHKNIAWKKPIRGLGWSSPAIKDDRLWLTTALDKEKSLRLLCLDCRTGETIHDVEVFRKESLGGIHPKNSHATPTPILVDDRCYVHFGSHGTAALTLDGEILWNTELKYYHHHGPAASPVIVGDMLIVPCDGYNRPFYDERTIAGITDHQFVAALEAATGAIRWKTPRVGTHSYATPLVIEVNGQMQVVSPGGNQVVAYDPATGAEIWSCRYKGYSVVPRPVYGHGLVFVCTGYDSPTLLAIRPDGQGDVTDTHVVWQARQAVPLNPSPILIGDELYIISDLGVASCFDAGSGKVHWRKRLGGNHSASPLYADGHLYFLDEGGTTQVVEPGMKCKILAKNLLRDRTQASMAAAGRALYLRSDSHLYRIEDRDAKPAE
jgi:outer membrane protein assembly factor BamB